MSLDASAEAAVAAPDTTTAPEAQPAPAAAQEPTTPEQLRDIQLETAKRLLAGEPAEKSDEQKTHHSKTQPRDEATKRWTNTKPDGSPADAKPKDGEADETAAEAAQDDSKPKGGTEQPQAKEPPAAPPSWLSPDLKARWDTMSPDVRDSVAAFAAQARESIGRLGRTLESYRPFEATAREHQDFFKSSGAAPHQVFDNLMRWNAYLERSPAAAIRALASTYGVDLAQSSPAQQYQQNADQGLPPDAQTLALQNKIQQLEGIIANLDRGFRGVTTRLSAQDQAEQEYREQQAAAAVNDNEDALARFEVQLPDFKQLLEGGEIAVEIAKLQRQQPNLSRDDLIKEAYERARWANKGTRERLMSEQTKAQEKQRQDAEAKKRDDAAKAAANARKAGQANVRGVPGTSPQHVDVADAQKAALRKFGYAV